MTDEIHIQLAYMRHELITVSRDLDRIARLQAYYVDRMRALDGRVRALGLLLADAERAPYLDGAAAR